MAVSLRDAGQAGRNERASDAGVDAAPKQIFRIVQFKCEAQQRGNCTERDIALLPIEAQIQGAICAAKHHAAGADFAGIGTGAGLGKRKARNVCATGEARQIARALRLRAVVHQQLRRANGVWHTHHSGQHAAARGEFCLHSAVARGRKTQAAVCARNDHAQKALLFDEVPRRWRQVLGYMHVPITHHGTQLIHRPIHKCLLGGGQLRIRFTHQARKVWPAGEQLAIHPHAAGFNGDALGFGDDGQQLQRAQQAHHGPREQHRAQRRHIEQHGKRSRHTPKPSRCAPPQQRQRGRRGPQPKRSTAIAQRADHKHNAQQRSPLWQTQ